LRALSGGGKGFPDVGTPGIAVQTGGLTQKILTLGRKGVQQRTGFQTDAAVYPERHHYPCAAVAVE